MSKLPLKILVFSAMAVVLLAAPACTPAGRRGSPFFRKSVKSASTYEVLQELLKKKDYKGAYMLFSDEYKAKYAPTVEKFAERSEKDGKLIAASEVLETDEGYDWGRAVVTYGDENIEVFFARSEDMATAGGIWYITTEEHFEDVKNGSTPRKSFYNVLRYIGEENFEKAREYFTFYTREHVNSPAVFVPLLLFASGKEVSYQKRDNWALWQRMAEIPARFTGTGRNETQMVSVCFVKRDGRWLLTVPDEFLRTREMYGDGDE